MAKFQYIGDGKQSPRSTIVFGVAFKLNGPAVEVASEKHAAKLRGNPTFLEITKGVTPREQSPDDTEEREPSAPPPPVSALDASKQNPNAPVNTGKPGLAGKLFGGKKNEGAAPPEKDEDEDETHGA